MIWYALSSWSAVDPVVGMALLISGVLKIVYNGANWLVGDGGSFADHCVCQKDTRLRARMSSWLVDVVMEGGGGKAYGRSHETCKAARIAARAASARSRRARSAAFSAWRDAMWRMGVVGRGDGSRRTENPSAAAAAPSS